MTIVCVQVAKLTRVLSAVWGSNRWKAARRNTTCRHSKDRSKERSRSPEDPCAGKVQNDVLIGDPNMGDQNISEEEEYSEDLVIIISTLGIDEMEDDLTPKFQQSTKNNLFSDFSKR